MQTLPAVLSPRARVAMLVLLAGLLVPLLMPAGARAAEYELRDYGTKCVSGQTDERRHLYVVCHNELQEGYLRVVHPDGQIVASMRMPGANDVAPAPDGSYFYVSGGAENNPLRKFVRRADGSYVQDTAWRPPTFRHWGRTYEAQGRQVATDAAGNLYVAMGMWSQSMLHVITKFTPDGRHVATIGDFTNTWELGKFYSLGGLGVSRDGRHVYASEVHNGRVQRFDRQRDGSYALARAWGNSAITDPFRLGNCVPGMLAAPYDLAVDGWGDVWVTSTSCTHVQKFSKDGAVLFASFVGNRGANLPGVLPGRNQNSHNLAVDGNGNVLSGETSTWLVRTGPVPAWPAVDLSDEPAPPAPAPQPQPQPDPAPQPQPDPAPQPDPNPNPNPVPRPQPDPNPAPAPDPAGPDRSAPIIRNVTLPETVRSRFVTVTIDAIDDRAITHVRMATDNGDDWTAWQPYAAQRQFTLRAGIGYRGVYVHVRDAAGNESNIFYRRTHVLAQEPAPEPPAPPAPAPAPVPQLPAPPAPAPAPDPAPAPPAGPDRSAPVLRDVTVPATSRASRITLTVDAIDDRAVSHVRLATDNGDDWTAWQPYTPELQFTLRAGTGYRGVYVHVRDAAGNESNILYRRVTVTG